MERTAQTSNGLRYATAMLLMIACSGCGTPMAYHFKHYHRPFEAIARSNKTYFHSQQTGRIIEKEPCASYCEPPCFGYEPTCWTQWPAECEKCPVQGEVLLDQALPMEGAIEYYNDMSGEIPTEMPVEVSAAPGTSDATYAPIVSPPAMSSTILDPTATPLPTMQPVDDLRVPSIPIDLESSIPSPSDGTQIHTEITSPVAQRLKNAMRPLLGSDDATFAGDKSFTQRLLPEASPPPADDITPVKVLPRGFVSNEYVRDDSLDSFANITPPTLAEITGASNDEPTVDADVTTQLQPAAEAKLTQTKTSTSLDVLALVELDEPEATSVAAKVANATKFATQRIAEQTTQTKPAVVEPTAPFRFRPVADKTSATKATLISAKTSEGPKMKLTEDESTTLRFAKEPTRTPARMSAVAEDVPALRFR